MKRIFLFFFLIALIASCGKEKSAEDKSGTGNSFLKFKVDGTSVEYRNFVFATKSMIENQYLVTIQGQKDISSNVPGLGIFIQDTTNITKQTYTDGDLSSGNAVLYSDTATANFSSLYMTDPSELKIIITKIDSASVRGTFSSRVADLNANSKTITDGEFFALFQ